MSLQQIQLPRRSRRRVPFVLSNFGGLNDDNNNAALEDRDLRTARNVMFYRERLMGGRFGYYRDPFSAAQDGGNPVTGIVDWQPDRGTIASPNAPSTIFVIGNQILEDNVGDGTGTDHNAGPVVTITAGANNVYTFGQLTEFLYGANGVDQPWELKKDGTVATIPNFYSGGDARTPRYLHSQFGYLFAGGYTATQTATLNNMTTNYSELQDANTWIVANVVDKIGGFASWGDEHITGYFRHRDLMMIGTNKRIYPVTYTGDIFGRFAIQRPLEVGLAHQRAVVSINGEFTFFMSPQGEIHSIREVAGTFGDVGVSRTISSKIGNYVSNLNKSRIQFSHGTFFEDRGWCVWAVSQGVNQATHNELIVLDINQFPLDQPDPRAARWLRFTNVDANAMAVLSRLADTATQTLPSANGVQRLYFGTETGWAKSFTEQISFDEADDGTQAVIDTEIATKYFDFGSPNQEKAVVEGIFDMEPSLDIQGPTLTIEYDYGTRQSISKEINVAGNAAGGFLLGTDFVNIGVLGGTQNITRNRIALVNAGTNASMKIQKKLSGTQKWKMQAATLVVAQRGLTPENP